MRQRFTHLWRTAADIWAERSAFVILPVAAIAYSITVWLMLRDVM